jgi:hypothetical protein
LSPPPPDPGIQTIPPPHLHPHPGNWNVNTDLLPTGCLNICTLVCFTGCLGNSLCLYSTVQVAISNQPKNLYISRILQATHQNKRSKVTFRSRESPTNTGNPPFLPSNNLIHLILPPSSSLRGNPSTSSQTLNQPPYLSQGLTLLGYLPRIPNSDITHLPFMSQYHPFMSPSPSTSTSNLSLPIPQPSNHPPIYPPFLPYLTHHTTLKSPPSYPHPTPKPRSWANYCGL